ncbi:MAG: hypothetical protein MRERV_71c002 [Mycoplasmataceae bacterium RV_VA103A]|nr:MAG: hypothetical protein MRERV_71c002 [Mycoplasmataceae bacterium RV_VA103A]
MKNGINIIVGENNTGKTRLLNYIFNQNEDWDKLNEKYKSGFKTLPIFFRSFGDGFPIHDPSNRHSSAEEKGKLKCSYEIYYFDLKSNFPFLTKEEKKIIDKGIEFENIKERSCVVYYTEDNLEKVTEILRSVVMKEVGETKNPNL